MHPSAGGPPVVVENFAREAGRSGHTTEIVSTPMFCRGDEPALLARLNALAPTTFLAPSRTRSLLDGRSWRQLDESIRAADIVHVHTIWNPINLMVRRACARRHRPYVLMPHGMLDPYSLSVSYWRKVLYLWAIERGNLASARRIIYTTAEEARLAATQMSSLPEGVIIPLGGDAPDGNADELASSFIERFPKARNRRQLLFLGRVHPKKGLDRILAALPAVVGAFPDVLMTIVGDGPREFQSELSKTVAAHNLEDNVLMTGRLDGEAKWGAYASAELFLLPSRQENFAITVAEAMQMGLPLIISNKVNTWPYVRDAGSGLVLDEDRIEADLEDGIVSLLRDVANARLMGKRGREYAKKCLTWAGATTRLIKCYDEVLGRAPSHELNG
jgi:glycosyltransferase involved in cell wall biosynthesis